MLPTVQMEARVVEDAELRFAASGVAVAKFRAVASSRKKITENGQEKWVDDKTCWISVTCFKKLAENVAESCTKGTLVNVTGRLQTDEWEDKETKQKRTAMSLVADTVSISLAFRSVSGEQKAERSTAPVEDPWSTPAGGTDEPPF